MVYDNVIHPRGCVVQARTGLHAQIALSTGLPRPLRHVGRCDSLRPGTYSAAMLVRPSLVAVFIAVTGCGGTTADAALSADNVSQLTCLDWNITMSPRDRHEVAGLLLTEFLDEVGWDYPVTPEGAAEWSKIVSAECGDDPALWLNLRVERLAQQWWDESLADSNP